MFFPFFNINYLIYMLPAFLLMMLAQSLVNSAYKKWSQVPVRSRMTGADAARRMAQSNGLYNIQVQLTNGKLTDNYDPRDKVLHLSQEVANGYSVAAVAIAAHELGHAMQDQEGYLPLRLRAAMVPAVNIGSSLGWILIFAGLIIGITQIAWVGVAFFAVGAVFALATLPVELNASSRARQILVHSGIVMGEDEQKGVNAVLSAAAFTYIAALATAVMQVLYYVSLLSGGRRRS